MAKITAGADAFLERKAPFVWQLSDDNNLWLWKKRRCHSYTNNSRFSDHEHPRLSIYSSSSTTAEAAPHPLLEHYILNEWAFVQLPRGRTEIYSVWTQLPSSARHPVRDGKRQLVAGGPIARGNEIQIHGDTFQLHLSGSRREEGYEIVICLPIYY